MIIGVDFVDSGLSLIDCCAYLSTDDVITLSVANISFLWFETCYFFKSLMFFFVRLVHRNRKHLLFLKMVSWKWWLSEIYYLLLPFCLSWEKIYLYSSVVMLLVDWNSNNNSVKFAIHSVVCPLFRWNLPTPVIALVKV